MNNNLNLETSLSNIIDGILNIKTNSKPTQAIKVKKIGVSQKDLVMMTLESFFRDPDNMAKMLPIVIGQSQISLRVIDWFVTNYAKKHDVKYRLRGSKKSEPPFRVYTAYRAQLKAYSKKVFDPFCRRERIDFEYNPKSDPLETTVGQLNFFRWAIENGVINYIAKHFKEIDEDMIESTKEYGKKKKKTIKSTSESRKKRKMLSDSATEKVIVTSAKITISFN